MCLEVQVGNKGEKRYAGALCALIINMKSTEIYLQWWTHDCMSAIGERCCFSKDVVVKEKKFHKKNVFDSGNRRLDIFIINQSDNQMI